MTMTDDLLALAGDAKLWHDTDKRGFATIPVNGHKENVSLRSKGFRHWLGGRYFEEETRAASRSALDAAVETLSAKSTYAAPERATAFRLAQHDGAIYIDLADADWRAIKVTPEGWEVVSEPPSGFCAARACARFRCRNRVDR